MNRFELKPSGELKILHLIVVAMVFLLVVSHDASLLLKTVAMVLLVGLTLYFYRQKIVQQHHLLTSIMHSDQGWVLCWQDGSESAVELQTAGAATPYFIVLKWRDETLKKSGQTLVWRDALSEADFRHLRRLYLVEKIGKKLPN